MTLHTHEHKTARAQRERGAALVEFALVAPLLVLLLLAMLDLGKAFNYWIDETHLANMGARYAVVNSNPGASSGWTLQRYIREQADTAELKSGGTSSIPNTPGTQVQITYPGSAAVVGQPVQVRVSTCYNLLPFVGQKIGILKVRVAGIATMRLEQVPSFSSTNDTEPAC